jgi:hypothetical protein
MYYSCCHKKPGEKFQNTKKNNIGAELPRRCGAFQKKKDMYIAKQTSIKRED